jgi:transcriptional regulator with XRE-family HTH domain
MPTSTPPSRTHRQNKTAQSTAGPQSEAQVNVGQRLRTLRAERDLPLRVLAERSGLNINTLSLIENDRTSPSVSTLHKIARALDVSISVFFETDAPKNVIAYVKADERVNAVFRHGTLADLGSGLAVRAMEPFVVTLEPNMDSGQQSVMHAGQEFVFCLKGQVLYTIEDQPYLLAAGDSLLFEARLPHSWENVDSEIYQVLLVLCPGNGADMPGALHLLFN